MELNIPHIPQPNPPVEQLDPTIYKKALWVAAFACGALLCFLGYKLCAPPDLRSALHHASAVSVRSYDEHRGTDQFVYVYITPKDQPGTEVAQGWFRLRDVVVMCRILHLKPTASGEPVLATSHGALGSFFLFGFAVCMCVVFVLASKLSKLLPKKPDPAKAKAEPPSTAEPLTPPAAN